MGNLKLIAILMAISLLAGCSGQPVGGNTGESSVFDETISLETTTTPALEEIQTLDRILLHKDKIVIQVTDSKGSLVYSVDPSETEKLKVDKGDRMDQKFPVFIHEGDQLGNTSPVFQHTGYLSGICFAKKVTDTKSTIVYSEDNGATHIDLLEIVHGEGEKISLVWLDDSMGHVYYEVTDSAHQLTGVYVHDLFSNQLNPLMGEDLISAMGADNRIHQFDRRILDGVVTEVGVYELNSPEAYEGAVDGFDVVIADGIVFDPDTDTIKVGYDIGLIGNKIAAITDEQLQGSEVIDANGLVVAPGFIDMLGFNLTTTVSKYKITDGVTTNLSLHGCTIEFEEFFRAYENTHPQFVNFGGAVFAFKLRQELGLGGFGTPTREHIQWMADKTREQIEEGAVAVAFSPEYYPGTTADEIIAVMKVAAEYDIPTHFHLRYSSIVGDDIGIKGVEEVIGYARETGGRVQIMHLHSTGGTAMMDEALTMINEARAEGLQITFDIYPYDSWASRLSMQRFRPGWQERYGIDYEDLQIAGTNIFVTEDNFATYKAQGALAIAYAMSEEEMLKALSEPYAQVGSDGNIESETSANNHFRGAGTFSRILGKYVREEDVFSLMDGLRKMTINGARHLESVSEDMALRGRLQEGMIADITIFDYRTVLDQSSAEFPAKESVGIEYVLVSGQVGLRDGELQTSVRAGVGIKSDFIDN